MSTVPGLHVLAGYLAEEPSDPREANDAIVVRSARPPRVLRAFTLGPLDCCLFAGHDVSVHPHHQARHGDGLVMGYVVDGAVTVSQRGSTVHLQAGTFTFYDGASPYWISARGTHRYLVIRFPLFRIGLRGSACGDLVATDLSSHPSSHVMSSLLRTIADQEEPPSLGAREYLADAVTACLNAVVAERADDSPSERCLSLFNRLALSLEEHLHDPDLSADTLARLNFLSTRHIRTVFAENGTTVSRYVRQRRLERIRHELLDPRQAAVPVSAVAARWGIRNPSVFSRAFSEQYGESPMRYRARHSGR